MRRLLLTWTCLGVLIGGIGCDPEASTLSPQGRSPGYDITVLDQGGSAIARGWITWESDEDQALTGQWAFSADERENLNNPFPGQGDLAGERIGDSLWVDLHPGWADNNIFLYGKVAGDSLNGNWIWTGFPGIIDQGRFKGHVTTTIGD